MLNLKIQEKKMLGSYSQWYDKREKKILEDLFAFLRFPSVSSEPDYKSSMISCAQWVKNFLENSGLQTEVWETPVHPTVFGSYIISNNYPTLLFYGHYDVQPVDPLNLWESDPFEPVIRDGKIYGRGTCDNKGQCFYTMLAVRAFLEIAKEKKINIKICIEGEEENGSEGFSQILPQKKKQLDADFLFIVDVEMASNDKPTVTLGYRGICSLEVKIHTADKDVHSGLLGGIALNPIKELVLLLSNCWDEKGRVAIPGFYRDVRPVPQDLLSKLDLSFDEEEFKTTFGFKGFYHEEGYGPKECNCIRPTFEINGFKGGYTGEGFKTVIPAFASAKISCRLVPDQDPEKIGHLVLEFLKKNVTKGIDVNVELHQGGKPVWLSDSESALVKMVVKAFEEVFDKPCIFRLGGGSLPIGEKLAIATNAEMIFIGTALPSDGMHAPNEHFGLDRLKQGFLIIAKILELASL